jgi:hypothetical protein
MMKFWDDFGWKIALSLLVVIIVGEIVWLWVWG